MGATPLLSKGFKNEGLGGLAASIYKHKFKCGETSADGYVQASDFRVSYVRVKI